MTQPLHRHGLRANEARLDDLQAGLAQKTDPRDCPNAAHTTHDVPVYDCAALRTQLHGDDGFRSALMAEWARVWEHGPGILVLKGALPDHALVDAVTQRFQAIIESERHGQSGGDRFAKAGANDRVWNALEKLCLLAPALFARYYASDMIALASHPSHRLAPMLPLQGAVAHVDMPLESGPTLYLPHSQKFSHGYLVAERADFRTYFEQHRV